MRFYISPPPSGTGSAEDRLEALTSWLYALAEELNVTLNSLTEGNFSGSVRERMGHLTERNDQNDI